MHETKKNASKKLGRVKTAFAGAVMLSCERHCGSLAKDAFKHRARTIRTSARARARARARALLNYALRLLPCKKRLKEAFLEGSVLRVVVVSGKH